MKTGNMSLKIKLSGSNREIGELLKSAVVMADEERVIQCLKAYIDLGVHPAEILGSITDGLVESLRLYSEKKKYLPELLLSFLAFAEGVDFIRKKW